MQQVKITKRRFIRERLTFVSRRGTASLLRYEDTETPLKEIIAIGFFEGSGIQPLDRILIRARSKFRSGTARFVDEENFLIELDEE